MSEPIGDYALLSDCQGSALVSRGGSIDWACLPRFDSPSTFARLLDERAGHWRLGPAHTASSHRAYLDDTMVLRTTYRTKTGTLAVTDALALGIDERGHQIGHASPHVLLRIAEVVEGHVEVETELAIRPEYGLTVPVLFPCEGGWLSRGGPTAYALSTDAPIDAQPGRAVARWRLDAGQRRRFALLACSPWDPAPPMLSAAQIDKLVDDTIAGWRSWSGLHQSYDGPYAELVRHSGRVLQALTYAPSGAVVAAPTTSLPETAGGERNWDYRFCWVRDASLTLQALWVAACPDEAADFFDFFATAAGGEVDGGLALQIVYGIGGERLLTEHRLDHLAGWRDSRPVRVGNGAWDQVQLDVFGELLDAFAVLSDEIGELPPFTREFLVRVADAAALRWVEPDQGIWEVRGGPQHFLYSKLMCWVALDRAINLADRLQAQHKVPDWMKTRDEIRSAIECDGWSDTAGAYTQAFGSDALDASALRMPMVGFVEAGEPRMRSTIEAIAAQLTDEQGMVYRYRADDGLSGAEGSFVFCTFWLARCLALLGQPDRARTVFDRAAAHANDVGLLAEEVDFATGDLLGNFPQAFSHIGLITAAWAIAQAEHQAPLDAGPPAPSAG